MKRERSTWLLMAILLGLTALVVKVLLGCAPAPEPVGVRITSTQLGNLSRLFDWGGHDKEPWDAVQFATWAELNPSQGTYSWAPLEARLNAVAPKKVHVLITLYRSDGAALVYDGPAWAGAPKVLSGCGTTAVIPPYDNAVWRGHYYAFVAALGAKYDGDPRLSSVVVSTGLDSETQPTKATTCDWMGIIRGTALEYRFGRNLIPEALAAYAKAFPRTPLYLSSAPTLGRMERAKLAASYGVGLKHAGMWYDLDSWEGYGGAEGSWDAMRAYSRTLPIWVESPHWGNAENLRWSLYAGLSYYPNGMSLHPDFLALEPWLLDWTAAHVNTTVGTAPSAWVVLRDFEYPPSDWGGKGVRGHVGNWGQWMTVMGGERVWRADLPAGIDRADWRARQSRRADGQFVLRPEVGFACAPARACEVRVTLASISGGWLVWRGDGEALMVGLPTDGRWQTVTFPLDDWEGDAMLEAPGAYVHMVEVARVQNVTETVTPCTPTATMTATPDPTATATLCPTMTPMPTCTETPTVVPSYTAISTQTPTPWPYPTETRTIEDDAAALLERMAKEWGVRGRVYAEVGE